VYILELCFTVGNTVKLKLWPVPKFEVSMWAAGTVSIFVAEAGVRMLGKLIDGGLKFAPQKTEQQVCLAVNYWLNTFTWECGFVYRTRRFRYSGRRRWAGKFSYDFGGWAYIGEPLRVVFGGSSEKLLVKRCTSMGAAAAGGAVALGTQAGCPR